MKEILLISLTILAFICAIGYSIYRFHEYAKQDEIAECARLQGKLLVAKGQQYCLDTEKDVFLLIK